ncbi:DUF2199 domain-containing protein [Agromyces sp. NPDC056379]|uniref:DUF2199 domain-containing protein n=1 Tax=unclassified Agromyces TaxID=2639701 RepID=UPI0035DE1E65
MGELILDTTCTLCGHEVDLHDRNVRFRLPDPLVDVFGPDHDVWMSHPDPNAAVMMQGPGFGAFVRALLPVNLIGGHTVTYGVWVGIHPTDLERAFSVWESAEYAGLELDGFLANTIGPWQVLGAPVHLTVRSPDETPYCDSSDDPSLRDILSNTWPHGEVLATLPA